MLRRSALYVRQHHIAFLALFLAAGGGGAVAATLQNGQVRGFEVTASNGSGTSKGAAGKLGNLTVRYSSHREEDARTCTLSVRAGKAGQANWFYGVKPLGAPKSYDVSGKSLTASDSATVMPMLRSVKASVAAVKTAIASAPAASARASPRSFGTSTG